MKITLEHYGRTISIETDHDDVNFNDYVELLRTISLAAGYSVDSIVELFDN